MTDPNALVLAFAAVAARLALAVVFTVAGVAKLRAADGAAARLLGAGELAVAIALVPTASALLGSVAAVILLGAFTAAIVTNLAHGRQPAFRCFGQLTAAPIGTSTLARSLALLAVAALASLASPDRTDALVLAALREQLGWAIAVAALCGVLAIQTYAMLQILRRQGRMLQRMDALEGLELVAGAAAIRELIANAKAGARAVPGEDDVFPLLDERTDAVPA